MYSRYTNKIKCKLTKKRLPAKNVPNSIINFPLWLLYDQENKMSKGLNFFIVPNKVNGWIS